MEIVKWKSDNSITVLAPCVPRLYDLHTLGRSGGGSGSGPGGWFWGDGLGRRPNMEIVKWKSDNSITLLAPLCAEAI